MKKFVSLILVAGLLATLATGCSGSSAGDDNNTSGDVTVVRVGTNNAYDPYCYLDENGDLVGYEIDLLKAVDEKLPQYEFVYDAMAFENLLLSLDSDKLDLVSCQFEKTEEREEKYLFANESYGSYSSYITVPADNTDINSLEDLQGRRLNAMGATSAVNAYMVKWNENHADNPIILANNSDTSAEYVVTSLLNGLYDAHICQALDVEKYNQEFDNALKMVGDPITTSNTFFLYNKDSVELQEAVDGALKELKDDGTMAALSIQWLGGDYTK